MRPGGGMRCPGRYVRIPGRHAISPTELSVSRDVTAYEIRSSRRGGIVGKQWQRVDRRPRRHRPRTGAAGRGRGVHHRRPRDRARRWCASWPAGSATPISRRKNGVFGTEGFPFLLGHEGAGVVERVGEGVTNVAPGDHVILAWRAPCGDCRFCLAGQAASLRRQPQRREAHAHHGRRARSPRSSASAPSAPTPSSTAKQCIPYDPALPPEQMSLIGCGVMTGVGAALYAAGVKPGTSAWRSSAAAASATRVIMGARLAGATTIIARRHRPAQAGVGQASSAPPTPSTRSEGDPVAAIKAHHRRQRRQLLVRGGRHRRRPSEQALFCRDLAGTCVIIGVPGPGPTLELPLCSASSTSAARLRVSWYGDCLPTRDFPLLADVVPAGPAQSGPGRHPRSSRSTRRRKPSTPWSGARRCGR